MRRQIVSAVLARLDQGQFRPFAEDGGKFTVSLIDRQPGNAGRFQNRRPGGSYFGLCPCPWLCKPGLHCGQADILETEPRSFPWWGGFWL